MREIALHVCDHHFQSAGVRYLHNVCELVGFACTFSMTIKIILNNFETEVVNVKVYFSATCGCEKSV